MVEVGLGREAIWVVSQVLVARRIERALSANAMGRWVVAQKIEGHRDDCDVQLLAPPLHRRGFLRAPHLVESAEPFFDDLPDLGRIRRSELLHGATLPG